MNEVKAAVYKVILGYTRGKTIEDLEKAVEFTDIELDSVSVVSILDEVEDELDIEFVEVPSMTISLPDFVALVERLVAEKNAG